MKFVKNTKSFFALGLAASLLTSAMAQARMQQGINAEYTCSPSKLQGEPLSQVKKFATGDFDQFLALPNEQALFSPKTVAKEIQDTGIVRNSVSSSHIVQIVADGLRQIKRQTDDLIKQGKLEPVEDGKTYSYDEYQKRMKSEEAARKQFIEPLLSQMYRVYINALADKKSRAEDMQMTPALQAFMKKAQNQRDELSKAIAKTIPTLKDKIGEIVNVTNTNLPLSYHDGAIVKIRFQRAGESHEITLYPTMLLNQLTGEDEYFLKGMERWVSYTEGQWTVAKELTESKGLNFVFQYSKDYLEKMFGWTDVSPKQLESMAPLMKEAYEKAKADYDHARWVHDEAAKLSANEVLALLDLFRSLRFGDVPQCLDQINQMNAKMGSMLPKCTADQMRQNPVMCGSASAKLSKEQKAAIDGFARDVAFYQDQYKVYSTAAAIVLVNRRQARQ